MTPYHVTWEIDLDAETPREAAETVQRWMEEGGVNWCFTVTDCQTLQQEQIDLEVAEKPDDLRSHRGGR